jgi:hypothetical protein
MKCAALIITGIFVVGALAWFSLPQRDAFVRTYDRIAVGMSLEAVETMLGKGELLDATEVPQTPDFSKPVENRLVPVVKGNVVYIWRTGDTLGGKRILVGFKDGKVVDKCRRVPSL